jgi:hypothetical protein
MPVGAGDFVVVPSRGRWRLVGASDSSGSSAVGDGLLSAGGNEQEGFVLPEGGGSGEDRVAIYVAGVGGRLMSRAAFDALEDAIAGGFARAVWIATDEAQRSVDSEIRNLLQVPRELRTPQLLEVVWTGRLPNYPHAAIVVQGRGYGQAVALGFTETPDEEDAGEVRDVGQNLLGFGGRGRSGSNQPAAVVAGDYVEFDDVEYLLLAGTGVETLHALVGDREISRRAPAALIEGLPSARVGDRPDTVIYGTTADGEVITPLNIR